ncbi:MAG TPA: nuclear transport factor 2 family protein [Kofleriaceae bacterium]|nr:nuclear transport factor 2 family protein [Kofleriaceae bacterium]
MTPHTPDQPSSTIRTNTTAKADSDEINVVLRDYIEGTANGEPDRVRNAFHEDLKLYSIKGDSLEVWEGKGYVDNIEAGKKNARQGGILFVDYEKDAAIAKIEILIPGWCIFTDYLMLLKVKGEWKIIHKSFTYRAIETKK